MTTTTPTPRALPEQQAVDQIAAAVLAVEGVNDLHAGALGEVATYLPGRRVAGVRLRGDDAEVHVVTDWGAAVLDVGQRVRAAVEKMVAGSVSVTIEDVADPNPSGQPEAVRPSVKT